MTNKLNINVRSFSYKKEIPADPSGNGGGFVFDCRGILNPGRIKNYKSLTGRDREVIDYLEKETKILEYLKSVFAIVDLTIDRKSTRLNSSHVAISYAVFCLKKKIHTSKLS